MNLLHRHDIQFAQEKDVCAPQICDGNDTILIRNNYGKKALIIIVVVLAHIIMIGLVKVKFLICLGVVCTYFHRPFGTQPVT